MWDTFWHFLRSTIVIFAFVAYLMIMFHVVADLFWRDRTTPGWVKAIWVVCLVVLPYLTALVYLIVRGGGMAQRAHDSAVAAKTEAEDYIREAAGRSPAQEILDAKTLLDSGVISEHDFEALKSKALR